MNALKRLTLLGALSVMAALFFVDPCEAAISTEAKKALNQMGGAASKYDLGTLIDNAEAVNIGDFPETVLVEATGTLTQANIIAMNGTPVTLIAAPGAGKVIIVDSIEWFHDYSTAVYSGGGDVTVEYETSGLDIEVFDVALVTASADDNWLFKTGGAAPYTTAAGTGSHSSLTANANKAVLITNASAVFADGNAANVLKYKIRYRVVTLLT